MNKRLVYLFSQINQPVSAIIWATVLIPIYLYFFKGNILYDFFKIDTSNAIDISSYNLQHIAFFVLFGIFPLILTLRLNNKSKYNYFGLQIGDFSFGIKAVIFGLLAAIAIGFLGSNDPSVTSEYPLPKTLLNSQESLVGYHLIYILFYYTAWEFFFRGFLFQSIIPEAGLPIALAVQTMASTLEHIGKPAPELLGAIPAGIIFGWIAYRSKSVIYVFLIHAALGVFTDLFIIYGR